MNFLLLTCTASFLVIINLEDVEVSEETDIRIELSSTVSGGGFRVLYITNDWELIFI